MALNESVNVCNLGFKHVFKLLSDLMVENIRSLLIASDSWVIDLPTIQSLIMWKSA